MGANCHLRSAQSRGPLDLINHTPHSTREHLRRILLTAEPRLRTLILHHEDCLVMHSARGEWEDGDRLERIMRVLTDPQEVSYVWCSLTHRFSFINVNPLLPILLSSFLPCLNLPYMSLIKSPTTLTSIQTQFTIE